MADKIYIVTVTITDPSRRSRLCDHLGRKERPSSRRRGLTLAAHIPGIGLSYLNTYLTVIGVFHSLVAYCPQELASRAATQVRTRAFINGTSSLELLNALPGSPE